MKVEIVPAEFVHVRQICENMRERERAAFEQLGEPPEKWITREVAASIVAYAGLADGHAANIWGAKCSTVLSDEAYIWMVCSELVNQHPIAFLRHSRTAIAELRPMFKRIHGLVLADFECSVRWLRWLGFEMDEPQNGVRAFRG